MSWRRPASPTQTALTAGPAKGGGKADPAVDGGQISEPRRAARVVFRVERRGPEFFARRISGVAIFPCEGGRDEASQQALAAAFDKGGAERVTRLSCLAYR